MKRYTFVTTYTVEAEDETKATEVKAKVVSQLQADSSVTEYWTILTDIEDVVVRQTG